MKISERASTTINPPTERDQPRLVTDEQVELALDWLRDNAAAIGEAKRQAVQTEKMVKHIEALAMKAHSEMPVAAQKREAQASDRYKQAILAEAEAAGAYEAMRSLREAAALKIEVWRSSNANYRAMKL
jgi:hypothetical protein